jgi:hypothetical protein
MIELRRIKVLGVWEGSDIDLFCHRSLKTVQDVNLTSFHLTSFLPKSEQYIRHKACITMIDSGVPHITVHNLIIRS